MRHRRSLGMLTALVLLAGCSQDKKNETPIGSAPSSDTTKIDSAKPEVKKPTPDELMAKAKAALANNDGPAAIAPLEQLVAEEPKNREALFLLSRVLQVRGMLAIQSNDRAVAALSLKKSAKYMKQLRSAYPKLTKEEAGELPTILYNEAHVLALTKESDAAIAALEDACNSGFADLDLLNKDRDLDTLRSLPRFQDFLKSATVKLTARAKEHAHEIIAAQKSFDFNFSLPDVDGNAVSRKDFAGKVLLVDIWGTWCPPCRQEIPNFVGLLKNYEDKGLRIIGINYEHVDAAEAPKVIREFASANHMNYPCLIGDEKTRNQVPDFQGFPTTLFLDRAGKVRLMAVGYHSMLELESIVQELLDEKTTSTK